MSRRLAHIFVFALMIVALAPISGTGAQVLGTDVTYTTDADFDQGTLVSVNHDAPYNDQLQLDSPTEPFPFINVAASGRGTVVRVNTETGEIVGEYRTAPEGRGLNPSRTTVDLFGNVWTANRDEVDLIESVPHGSAVKIGLIVGGTRVDGAGTTDPSGAYLAPPFGYNTCSDRDGDGLIRTSSGLGDILDWPDITDGDGGTVGLVEDAVDECILVYQRLANAEQARHVSVDADNNVWVGGYPFDGRMFYKLAGGDGAVLDSFDARDFGCGGYGGLIDGSGVLWSIGGGTGDGDLLRFDPATGEGMCVNTFGGYGLGIDTNGYVWASLWENGIAKVSPGGDLVSGFPKSTWLPPSTSTAAAAEAWVPMRAPALTAQPAMMVMQPDPATFTFWVAPADEWVASMSPWTPDTTISLTIEDEFGVVYTDSQTADGDGNFHFELGGVLDLQAGHLVTVSDGTTTKMHTVTGLGVTAVNVTADTVSGVAEDGSEVSVWVHGNGDLTLAAGPSGWVAGFSGTTDLTYLSDGGSAQYDDDGDATGVWWTAPRIQVSPDDDWVQSSGNWPVGATASLTIEHGGGVYSDSQVVDDNGRFNFELRETFDVQRGHVVTVSDGTDTKVHTVTSLNVLAIDPAAETVSGVASLGIDVDVWVHGDGNVVVTPDSSGHWTADFSGLTDITYGSDGGSQQTDIDGDSTGDWWSSPRFQAAPDDEWVQSAGPWTPGTTISLTVVEGSSVVYSDSQTADGAGNFHFGFGGMFDLERGHVVTVSDGTTTKTHTVEHLFVDAIDITADTVSGRADAGSYLDVWVDGYPGFQIQADGSGYWLADFAGITDLDYASSGGAQQADAEGDSTFVGWSSPRFQVAPDDNWVQADGRWTPGATISLTVEDGSGVVYADTQVADEHGWFNFDLWPFDLERGHLVTVSDGITTKTHTVIDLYVDGVNVTADTVFGRGLAGVDVEVWVHDDGNVVVTPDGSGNWVADFSGITDLTYRSDGGSQQRDEDGDSTGVWWASPSIQVQPTQDWIGSWTRWPANTSISITIDDGSGGTHSATVTTDQWGNFGLGLAGEFDVQRGDVVTASDGTTTKTHEVFDLYITDVDADTDEVHGTAAPGSDVEVQVHGPVHAWRVVTAGSDGTWTADFATLTGEGDGTVDLQITSDVTAHQYGGEGDVTWIDRYGPQFRVNPDNDQLWGWAFLANSPVTVIVDDDADPSETLYEWSGMTNEWGDVNPGLEFDVVPNHYVSVSDGETTKVHRVTYVDVTAIDTGNDTVSGTAGPGAAVEVNVSLFQNSSTRWVVADSGGNWTADFSVAAQDQPVFDIDDTTLVDVNEYDDDLDATNRRFGPPVQANRGVAVTPIDNHVWVANSGVGTVTRLDNDGNILEVIEVGIEPTGVAVDAAGKVWVTNLGSDNTMRIDPAAGSAGLGAVDLTVDLGPGASPYNYSDMTGAVVVGSTSPQGIWTVIQDSGVVDFEWGRITWNTEPEGDEPEGTAIVVEARTANTEAGLGGATFQPVMNGELFSSFGQFIEVRVTLKANEYGESPVLSDIRVQPALIEVGLDIKPGSYPNSINLKRTTGVVPVAVLGSEDFDIASIDVTTLRFGTGMAEPAHDLLDLATYADHVEDVNDDGFMDLVSHYDIADIGFEKGDTEACLVGETLSGIPIEGCDSVRIIGKK